MWAQPPQKSLSNLVPGLRPHPDSPPKWDSSNGFTAPIKVAGRTPLNLIPKYTFNNGVKPKTTTNSTAPTNGMVVRPREIQSADTKDANTTARPRIEHNSTVIVSDTVGTTSPDPVSSASTPYVAPHLRKRDKATIDRDVPQHFPISETQQNNVKVTKASPDKSIEANLESTDFISTKPSATGSTHSAQYQIPITSLPPVIVAASSPQEMSQYKRETSAPHHASPVLVPSTPSDAMVPSEPAKDMNEAEQRPPPHLRAPKSKPALPESQQEPKHQTHRVHAMDAGGSDRTGKPKSLEGKASEVNGLTKQRGDDIGKFQTVSLEGKASEANGPMEALGDENGKFVTALPKIEKKGKEKAINNGWDKPIVPAHELLGWDGARAEAYEDWENRPRGKVPVEEQLQRLEHWHQASELSASQDSAHVDTASPEFMQGAGIDGSLSNVHSEDAHHTTRLWNDPLTLAKSDLTTESVIEMHNAKGTFEKEGERRMSKQEKRDLRAALNQRNKECADMPNPYKPAADIYIRPAKVRDVPQIADIYIHYIKTSAVALELDPMTHDQWRTRMEDCRDEGYDMYVAVRKTADGNGHSRKDSCEPVFGFAYAEDQNDRRSSCRFAAVVQVYVNWKHLKVGVGRCLLDRVMAMVNINHCPKKGVEWVGEMPLVQREIKKVLIEIPYWDDSEEEQAIFTMVKNQKTGQMERVPGWKARWLESVQFEYECTLRGIGFKKACLEKGKR